MLIIKSMHLINLHFWTYLGAGGGGVRGSHARGRRGDEYAPLKAFSLLHDRKRGSYLQGQGRAELPLDIPTTLFSYEALTLKRIWCVDFT